jgi:hypothetical protein
LTFLESELPIKDLGPEPKKPRSAYNLFNADYVAELKKKDPEMKNTEGFKMAGQRWGEMKDADKTRFNELADKEKAKYQKLIE